MADEIERLRDKRGEQDFIAINPDDGDAVQRAAAFLADVEDEPHEHGNDPEHGLG